MRDKLRMVLFGLLFFIGAGALFVFQIYIQPKLNTAEVVVFTREIPRNEIISEGDVVVLRVSSDSLPSGYLTSAGEVIGKKTNVGLPKGMIVTPELIDIYDMNPSAGEMLFPIPKTAIYAVNASLRAGDYVKISLYKSGKEYSNDGTGEITVKTEEEELSLVNPVRIIAVRADSGNMVTDTEQGNTNDRFTATDRIGHLELLVTDDEAKYLKNKIREGYQVWASRVEG